MQDTQTTFQCPKTERRWRSAALATDAPPR